MKKYVSFCLALALLLTSCGGGTAAATMHLRRTEGTVGVADGEGKALEPKEDLGLYSGYGVDTQAESYAWIDLDAVKLTKLDQNSEVAIVKEGKSLEIEVKSGSLFFNVTEPLASDETMNIRTSSMVVGIRGTCGWVALSEDESTLTVGLLKGKVECSNGDNTAIVSAGEKGTIPASGEITVTSISSADIPAFVKTEIDDDALAEEAGDVSDTTVPDPVSDIMRLRDQYTYSKEVYYIYYYNGEGEKIIDEILYTPDEQGRIGKAIINGIELGTEDICEYVYNDEGTLLRIDCLTDAGFDQTVTEDTADHRKIVFSNGNYEIHYYDDQGQETKMEFFREGEPSHYLLHTYDAEGRRVSSEEYEPDGSPLVVDVRYEYD